jgi:murein peptide amidase A
MPNTGHYRVKTLGHSRQFRPIEGWFFNLNPLHPQVDTLFFGAFHGDEPESAQVLMHLLAKLKTDPGVLHGRCVAVVPQINPDGLRLNTRKNAYQVDINRNFPAQNWEPSPQAEHYHGGYFAASEPETQLVCRLLKRYSPGKIVTLHTPYQVINYDGPPCALALAQTMASLNGYPVEADIGYATPGSFGTYAGVEQGIPVITLELAEGVPAVEQWHRHHSALLAAIQFDA